MKLTAREIANLPESHERTVEYRDDEITGFFLRCLAAPSKSRTYFVRYTSPETGARQNFRIGSAASTTPAQARDAARKQLGKVAIGICPHAERQREKARVAAEKARAAATREHQELTRLGAVVRGPYSDPTRRKRPKRLDEKVARLTANFGHWFDEPLDAITEDRVQAWADDRASGRAPGGRRRPAAETTIHRDVQDLKGLLTFAVSQRLIPGPHALAGFRPFDRREEEEERVRYLEGDEEMRLRRAMTDRTATLQAKRESANTWRAARGIELLPTRVRDYLPVMVLLAMNTGLRRREVFTLRWDAVDFANRRVTVRGKYAKNGRSRDVPLNDEAMAVLTAWHAGTDPHNDLVFVSEKTGGEFSHVKTAWASLMRSAKIKDFRFHDLRHDFASKLVSRDVPLFDVGELLGHRDSATTRRYAHLAPERKAAAVATLNRRKLTAV